MKQYSKYKFSGIQWLGDIPDHWQVAFTSSAFSEVKCKNIGMVNTNLLSLSYGRIKRKDINSNSGLLPESFETYNVIKKGDIVFRLTDLQNDQKSLRTGLSTEDGIITSAYLTLRPDYSKVDSTYYQYLYHFYDVSKIFYRYGGGVRQSMNYDNIRILQIPLPPLAEQTSIAAYLDSKTANIDRRISLLRDKIEHYKQLRRALISNVVTRGVDKNIEFKNSGIQWLGDIPKHWMVKRVKDVVTLITVSSISDVKIGLENIESGTGKFIKTDTEFDGNGVAFMENDIIYGKLRPYLQKVWIAEFEGNAVGDFFVFRAKNDVDFNFIKWWMLSEKFTKKSDGSTFGAKMPRVSSDFILNLNFPLPPLAEQTAIAAYLDEKTAQIDAIVDKCEMQIAKLSELRRSLIAQAVTGQIKVC